MTPDARRGHIKLGGRSPGTAVSEGQEVVRQTMSRREGDARGPGDTSFWKDCEVTNYREVKPGQGRRKTYEESVDDLLCCQRHFELRGRNHISSPARERIAKKGSYAIKPP